MAKRKDDNQPDIEQALRKAGALVIDCTVAPQIGFDLLVGFRGSLFVLEVKNPARIWQLTKGERERGYQLLSVGVTYHIVQDAVEALRAIGAIK